MFRFNPDSLGAGAVDEAVGYNYVILHKIPPWLPVVGLRQKKGALPNCLREVEAVNRSNHGAGAVVAEALEYKKTSPFQNTAVATGLE